MMDSISPEKRSWNMSRIRGTDTSIEVQVRKYLFSKGFRYRKNDKRFPGKPDILLPKYKTAVFVHGCFWHRHQNCKYATTPKTRIEYWDEKFKRNVDNDKNHERELIRLGWNVIVLWECEIKKDFSTLMEKTIRKIESNAGRTPHDTGIKNAEK